MKIMKRLTQVGLAVLIAGLVLLLKGSSPLVTTATAQTQNKAQQQAKESTRSAPPDTTPYTRPALPEDSAPRGVRAIPLLPGVSSIIVDVVVNNTDPNLTNTDTFNDGETSIAVNPANINEIVITAFSESWGANAPLWRSTDGGNIWTKQFTIPAPPGVAAAGCPCDQAVDRQTGFVYSLFQRCVGNCGGDPKNINYILNRSTDGGATWILNGMPGGIIVANADSTQPQPKFGTVNALLGGADHAAVDPNNGDVYYVYGSRDAGTGNDRLAIRRIFDNGGGGVTVGPENFVTGQVEAAIPPVAVTRNAIGGVFYYKFDAISSGFPIFSAHLAQSSDQGVTFSDQMLETFLSSAADNGNPRQRVLGDYMQMKAVGACFYGAFTGNGVPFGRPFSNHDPIFFRACPASTRPTPTPRSRPTPAPRPTPPR